MHTTYSFLDLVGALADPDLGAYVFTGQGVGTVTVALDTERTEHNVAGDGVIMVSKIAGRNGKITITAQQTSDLHKWLLKAANAKYISETAKWATMSATLRNTCDGTSHIVTGISFGKNPDKQYQAAGQMVSWVLWAADIVSLAA